MTQEPSRLDVDDVRRRTMATVILRRPTCDLVVLGSSQPSDLVIAEVMTVRRRGGGGAVLIAPTETVWIDLWVPAMSPLAESDVRHALLKAGAAFKTALEGAGAEGLEIIETAQSGRGPAICFDALGYGELALEGAKLLGLSAWRCRQGLLFQTAMYLREVPDIGPLVASLDRSTATSVVPLAELGLGGTTGRVLAEALLEVVARDEPAELIESDPSLVAPPR